MEDAYAVYRVGHRPRLVPSAVLFLDVLGTQDPPDGDEQAHLARTYDAFAQARSWGDSARGATGLTVSTWFTDNLVMACPVPEPDADSEHDDTWPSIADLSYCGFVSSQRGTSRDIRGKHESIISEELFDRCADLRRQRTTTKNPGRPSGRFVLKGIARCERCEGRMHGQTSGKKALARYYCSTRRKQTAAGCDQPLAPADEIEQQIAAFVAYFTPSAAIRDEVMARLTDEHPDNADTVRRRAQLKDRRKRLADLFEMGDVNRAVYVAKRDAIDAELDSLAPGPTPDLDGARAVLEDFGRFWELEPDPVRRRELVSQLFEHVWIDERRVVAVRPTPAFAPFFARRPGMRGSGTDSRTSPPLGVERRGC